MDASVEIENLPQLTDKLNVYMAVNNREPAEIVNRKLSDVGMWAIHETAHATKDQIRTDLLKPSDTKASAPIASILVNKQRKESGKGGINARANPAKMQQQVESLIRTRERHRNFVRAGWKPGIKTLKTTFKDKKGMPPSDSSIAGSRTAPGGAQPAYPNEGWQCEGSISNRADAKDQPSAIQKNKVEGLNSAIRIVNADMDIYIERKLQELADQHFNNS